MGAKSFTSWHTFRYWQIVNRFKNGEPTVLERRVVTSYNRGGTNNPYRKIQIRNGNCASTNFSVTASKITFFPPSSVVFYTVKEAPSWVPYRTYDESVGLLNWIDISVTGHFGPFSQTADSRAISSLYRQLQNAHHQFQGGVFIGELRKSAQMIAGLSKNLSHGVFNYLSKATKLTKGKGPNKGRALNNLYLENVFGWQPLIGDVQNAAKAIARIVLDHETFRVRGFGKDNTFVTLTPGSIPANGSTLLTNALAYVDSLSVYYGSFRGAAANAQGIHNSAQEVVSLTGFDLASFIPTVWELIPYSFLIDYFLNVGELLEAMCTDTTGVQWISNVKKQSSIHNLSINYVGPTPSQVAIFKAAEKSDPSFNGSSGSCVREYATVTRTAVVPVPFLAPRFKLSELSGQKFLNIAALITR